MTNFCIEWNVKPYFNQKFQQKMPISIANQTTCMSSIATMNADSSNINISLHILAHNNKWHSSFTQAYFSTHLKRSEYRYHTHVIDVQQLQTVKATVDQQHALVTWLTSAESTTGMVLTWRHDRISQHVQLNGTIIKEGTKINRENQPQYLIESISNWLFLQHLRKSCSQKYTQTARILCLPYFDTILVCDRQTDTHRDKQTHRHATTANTHT